jgi:predicted RND superfamily exporter protein
MVGTEAVLVDADRRKLFLNIWGDFERSVDVRDTVAAIRRDAADLDHEIAVGSEFLLWVAQTDYLVAGKIISWLQALLLVVLLAALAYRNLRAPVVIGGAVLLVTLVILGLMAMLRIPLDIASTVITSMTIGVCADFAIHMVDALAEVEAAGESAAVAVRRALPPILVDAESNIVGFSTFLLSPLLPVRHAGLMLMISMLLGALAAMLFVPAALRIWPRRNKGDDRCA